jgi:hypothetical protein
MALFRVNAKIELVYDQSLLIVVLSFRMKQILLQERGVIGHDEEWYEKVT